MFRERRTAMFPTQARSLWMFGCAWRGGSQSQKRKTPLTQCMAGTSKHGQGPASLARSLSWYALCRVQAPPFLAIADPCKTLHRATQTAFPSHPERKKRALPFAGACAPFPRPCNVGMSYVCPWRGFRERNKRALPASSGPLVSLNIVWGGRIDPNICAAGIFRVHVFSLGTGRSSGWLGSA